MVRTHIDVTEQPADLVHVYVIQYANDLRTGTLVYREERIERVEASCVIGTFRLLMIDVFLVVAVIPVVVSSS